MLTKNKKGVYVNQNGKFASAVQIANFLKNTNVIEKPFKIPLAPELPKVRKYYFDDSGRLRRPDGKFASSIETIREKLRLKRKQMNQERLNKVVLKPSEKIKEAQKYINETFDKNVYSNYIDHLYELEEEGKITKEELINLLDSHLGFLPKKNTKIKNLIDERLKRPKFKQSTIEEREYKKIDYHNKKKSVIEQLKVNNLKKSILNFQQSDDKNIELDLTNFNNEKNIYEILDSIHYRPAHFTTIQRGSKFYAVSIDNINKAKEVGKPLFISMRDSWGDDMEELPNYNFTLHQYPIALKTGINPNKKRRNGNFFPFLNPTNINLSKYGIFKEINPENYENNCLQNALIASGIPKAQALSLIVGRDVPFIALNKICLVLNCYIELKSLRADNDSRMLKFGNPTHRLIKLGHCHDHYFIDETTKYTKYSINNYEELKDKKDFGLFYNARQRDATRCASSFDIIRLCLELNKFTPMEQSDKLQSTQYYDRIKSSITKPTISATKTNNPKEVKPQDLTKVYFADFETTTDQEKHIPYMCCVVNYAGDVKKTFPGNQCANALLTFLPTNSLIYFHNLGYDSVFISKWINIKNEIRDGTHCKMITGEYSGKSLVFKDSYAMISSPLRDFKNMFNLDVKKEIMPHALYTEANVVKQFVPLEDAIKFIKESEIDEFKIISAPYVIDGRFYHIEYAQFYCMQDCVVLAAGFKKFAQWINEAFNMSVYNFVSLPSLANECFILKGAFNDCVKLSGVMRDYIQQSVVGGRCMVSENKKCIKTGVISDFDAVSLYPSAIARLGYLKGSPKVLNQDQLNLNFLNEQTGYFIQIRDIKCNIRRKFPLLPMKDKNGTLQYVNDFPNEYIATVNKFTLEDLIKYQNATFTIISGVYFNEGRNDISKDFIRQCFEQRRIKKAEKNSIEAVFKLLMNSSYGKTMEKPKKHKNAFSNSEARHKKFININHNYIDEYTKIADGKYMYKVRQCINDHFSSPHIGSEILSMSKRIMNEVMCLAEDLGIEIFYQDTDSMHMFNADIERLSIEFNKLYNRDLIGESMGQFHTDFKIKGASDVYATKSIFIGKKCYVDFLQGTDIKDKSKIIHDEHIRLKGVPHSAIKDACKSYYGLEGVYMALYNGEEITFDLLADSVRFKRNKDYSYSTPKEFLRNVSFN